MAWVRLDDQIPRNQKILNAGPAACWLWVCAIAHCQSQLTDGFVSSEVLPMIGVTGAPRVRRLAETLVSVGLFDKADGGYQVHDYLVHNPSRAEVLQKRSTDLERKKLKDSTQIPSGIAADSRALARGRALDGMGKNGSGSLSGEKEQTGDVTFRAGELLRNYQRWYAEERNGARLRLIGNSLEFQEALTVVNTWPDDARIEKLARIVLTANDDFINKTDRSFKIFALKATWADDKLRVWEGKQATA
jgi:hypothetical protein